MKRSYFVSYHINFSTGWALGMGEFEASRGIDNMAGVLAIAKTIEEKNEGCTSVVILNWKEIDAAPGKPSQGEP